jgi:nitrogenase-stabilizing/protective protein
MTTTLSLASTLRELDTAEAFVEHFDIAYSRGVIDVNRLLILRRFHDALAEHDLDGVEEQEAQSLVRTLLQRAYDVYAKPKAAGEAAAEAPAPAKAESGPKPSARTFVPLAAIAGSSPKNGTR